MAGEPRLYARHVRACGICLIPGARNWFALHGLDWRDFLRNGIPVSTVEAIGDSIAREAVGHAMKEHNNG